MAKKKNHYYVLVCTGAGAKFVTGTEGHTAYWDVEKPPMEMSKTFAEQLVMGLNLNFNLAYMVCNKWEIKSHPYNYADYEITFTAKEQNND